MPDESNIVETVVERSFRIYSKRENNRCKREKNIFVLCYACTCGPKHIFGFCINLSCISVKTRFHFDEFCFHAIVKLS